LEYGMAGLPVICTNVGKCVEVLGKNGRIVEANDPKALANEILFYLENKEKMKLDAKNFGVSVMENYSQKAVIKKILGFYYNLKQ
jgi:glycosyltransferase involved in cell wall biosynthesis